MKIIKQDMRIWINNRLNSLDWIKNDKLHREDGPATTWSTGKEYYYLNDFYYYIDDYWKKTHANH